MRCVWVWGDESQASVDEIRGDRRDSHPAQPSLSVGDFSVDLLHPIAARSTPQPRIILRQEPTSPTGGLGARGAVPPDPEVNPTTTKGNQRKRIRSRSALSGLWARMLVGNEPQSFALHIMLFITPSIDGYHTSDPIDLFEPILTASPLSRSGSGQLEFNLSHGDSHGRFSGL